MFASVIANAEMYPNPSNTGLFSPSQYDNIARRMADISFESDLPYVFNNDVKRQMSQYYYENAKFVPIALARGKHLFPQIEKQLTRIGIPEELKYVAVIESMLNQKARSKAGAVGLWQLMTSTANDFNLKMSGNVDERKDVYKSTRAAGIFLKRLYKKYGDWFLALAAYNYGPGNINKVLKRHPEAKTFWDIQQYLPKETREYVPKFIAISYFMEYADDYSIQAYSRKRRAKVANARKAKRKAKQLAKMNVRSGQEVASEIADPPYFIRRFPIPVSNAINEVPDPSEENNLFFLIAELDAIRKSSSYDEDSDTPSDPLNPNDSDNFDVEALRSVRRELPNQASLGTITS